MVNESGEKGSSEPGDARLVALTEELGAQLRRMGAAGPKITQLLSMVQLEGASGDAPRLLGALVEAREPLPLRCVRRVIEQDLDARLQDIFFSFEEQPFAISSLGQVHRARIRDGEQVAVKVQHPDIADEIASDLRAIGAVSPIVGRLAPGSDAGALLSEVRERIADELDYELEAQHQRQVWRLFRDHPHVRVPRVHTDLSTRRVLVTEYVDGVGFDEIAQLEEAERDRIGEIVFRFFVGLVWRERIVAGDPHPDNCLLCPDGRVCLLDFALLRRLEPEYLDGERDVMRVVIDADPDAVHRALAHLGYLAETQSYDPAALLEHLTTAGEWLLVEGSRRIDPAYVRGTLESGYPPRSRVACLASGVAYAALCFAAVKILIGAGSSGGSSGTRKAAAGVLGWPGGTVLVGIAGAILIGVALYQGYKGPSRDFLDSSNTAEMSRAVKRGYTAIGVFGHLARMVIFGLIGFGLIKAAIDYNPHNAIGLDGALNQLAHDSYGPLLLGVVAAGLIGFALYSIADARYRKV